MSFLRVNYPRALDVSHYALKINMFLVTCQFSGFGGLVVSMRASCTQDRGFEHGRNRLIFRAKKSTACLPSEWK
jgi:hypothetical protein